ncbi:SpoIIE family protein phosphatase [Acidobacteriota bacterium]
MEKTSDTELREEILNRREKLQTALSTAGPSESLSNLLHEVDVTLEKMDKGIYGLCETCHEPIEEDRLSVNPLCRNCIDHLTPTEQRVLEQDLDLAYQIQNVLLPEQNFTAGGWSTSYLYEPAGPVSGDYLDLIVPETEDGSLVFLLGDVSGKGVAASMLMSHLHAIFRSLIKVNLEVEQMVEKANRIFCEATMLTHFATLVCGVARPSGEIEICNAGHCLPLLMREGNIESIESTSFPMGMFCVGQFSTNTVKLAPGDSLFLYSDGLSEARNSENIQYGDERLAAVMNTNSEAAPQGLIEACFKDLKDFQTGNPLSDDLTMLVIKRV